MGFKAGDRVRIVRAGDVDGMGMDPAWIGAEGEVGGVSITFDDAYSLHTPTGSLVVHKDEIELVEG